MAASRYTASKRYGRFYAGVRTPIAVGVLDVYFGDPLPEDLTGYDEIRFQAWTDGDASYQVNALLTLVTDDALKLNGVTYRAEGFATFPAAGTFSCAWVGILGAERVIFGSQWQTTVYPGDK